LDTLIQQVVRKNLKKNLKKDYFADENFKLASFEFAPKNKSITVRMSDKLLLGLKLVALERGTNYQRVVRLAIEQFLRKQVG